MPDAPSTPTPRRFLLKRDPPPPKPASTTLRNPAAQPTSTPKPRPTPKALPTPATSSHQFAQTPRFSFTQARSHDAPPTPQSAAPRPQRRRRPLTRAESIEDTSQETTEGEHGDGDGDREMLDASDAPDVQQTVEEDSAAHPPVDSGGDHHEREEGDAEMLFAPPSHPSKRRRLSPSLSPPLPDPPDLHLPVRSPPKPSNIPSTTVPAPSSNRFLLHPSQPASSRATTDEHHPAHRRPAFRLPQQQPTDTGSREPLPDAFSPHRRGQKFVGGGMADVVRGWVVDVGGSVTTQRRGRGDAGVVMKVEVWEVRGGDGVVLVRGRAIDGDGRVVLVGKARGEKGEGEGVRRGDVVGITAPSWEIEVGGERWSVGVDWSVLDGGGGEAGRT